MLLSLLLNDLRRKITCVVDRICCDMLGRTCQELNFRTVASRLETVHILYEVKLVQNFKWFFIQWYETFCYIHQFILFMTFQHLQWNNKTPCKCLGIVIFAILQCCYSVGTRFNLSRKELFIYIIWYSPVSFNVSCLLINISINSKTKLLFFCYSCFYLTLVLNILLRFNCQFKTCLTFISWL